MTIADLYQEAGIQIQGWPGPKLELYMELLFKGIYTYIYIYILIFGNLGTNVANGSIRILTFGYQCCKWIDPNIDIWVPIVTTDVFAGYCLPDVPVVIPPACDSSCLVVFPKHI